jgi:hypothetical protein
VIEVVLLFAVLVVAPLGFELARALAPIIGAGAPLASVLQPVAAIAVVGSFWQRPGFVAAALSVPWFVLGVGLTLSGILALYRKEKRSLAAVAVSLAYLDLAFAGGWLVLSRAGLHPMGFQEPVVLLTAVHFHYSGFAVAMIAGTGLHVFEERAAGMRVARSITWLVMLLPFALAAGFVISPLLRMAAALGLALCIPALAGWLLWVSWSLRVPVARFYLRLGAGATFLAMGLAGAYAVTEYAGKPMLTMPGMASTHGVLNALGFVLLSMLAFLVEMRAREVDGLESSDHREVESGVRRKPPSRVPQSVPEFVAREFYDR